MAVSARMGSEDCFSELVRRHRQRLFGLLIRRVGNREDAEDLTQETFVRAHQKLNLFDPARKFETWLFTIGTRLSYSFYRRKKVTAVELKDTDRVTEETPAGIMALSEQYENTWKLVAEILPPLQARMMWLRYGKDMSIREIADETGKSKVHVKVSLHRARTAMVKQLKNRGHRS